MILSEKWIRKMTEEYYNILYTIIYSQKWVRKMTQKKIDWESYYTIILYTTLYSQKS